MTKSEKIEIAFSCGVQPTKTAPGLGPASSTPGIHRGIDGQVYGVRRANCCSFACSCTESVLVTDPGTLVALCVPTLAELAEQRAASARNAATGRKFWREHDR
jgi:hypothetical protein